MRILVSIAVFLGSFVVMTAGCTWAWDAFVADKLYNCADSVPFDFLHPGDWVHHPVAVRQIVVAQSMSEPDTIRQGLGIHGLWSLWCCFVGVSLGGSFLLARLPFAGVRNGNGR